MYGGRVKRDAKAQTKRRPLRFLLYIKCRTVDERTVPRFHFPNHNTLVRADGTELTVHTMYILGSLCLLPCLSVVGAT
jgi:hypothetical protein